METHGICMFSWAALQRFKACFPVRKATSEASGMHKNVLYGSFWRMLLVGVGIEDQRDGAHTAKGGARLAIKKELA